MSLQEAAARLKKDPRTVIRAITAGEIRGGAMPRPERLRWYVYADELPAEPGTAAAAPAADAVVEDLRAQIVSLTEANRLLIAAQQELLEADQASQRCGREVPRRRAQLPGCAGAVHDAGAPGRSGRSVGRQQRLTCANCASCARNRRRHRAFGG